MSTTTPALYHHDHIIARKKFFKLFGAAFHLFSPDGELLAFSQQKAFKLKEDIRVYADEAMTTELMTIKADRVIDFSAAYQVVDSTTGQKIGALRRKGLKSIVRDSWEILDDQGRVRGKVTEDSGFKAIVRRVIEVASLLLPQGFNVEVDGRVVATMQQNHNIFVPKFNVDLSLDTEQLLPRPLAIATVILLLAIEGRQG